MGTVADSYKTATQLADEWSAQSNVEGPDATTRDDDKSSGGSSSQVADSVRAGMAMSSASKASSASAAEESANVEDAYSILSSKSKKTNKKPFGKAGFKRAMKTAGLASVKSKLAPSKREPA